MALDVFHINIYCPQTKQWRKKSWWSRYFNLGLLGGKQECFLCATTASLEKYLTTDDELKIWILEVKKILRKVVRCRFLWPLRRPCPSAQPRWGRRCCSSASGCLGTEKEWTGGRMFTSMKTVLGLKPELILWPYKQLWASWNALFFDTANLGEKYGWRKWYRMEQSQTYLE